MMDTQEKRIKLPKMAPATTLNTIFSEGQKEDIGLGRGQLWEATRKSTVRKNLICYADLTLFLLHS